ncbi:MAG: tetratricopeptide repeat protein [Myxococcales bacterium]|nr:tetratricopeptide repeat protein [Myxococcales bacterium]
MAPDGFSLTGPRLERWGLALAIGAFAFVLSCSKVYDYDFWWHLATGEWILQQGRIPLTDPFGFATFGASWVPHSWAAEVGLALLHRVGGVEAVILSKAALVAGGFALAHLAATRRGVSPYLAASALLVAAAVARFQFRERPQVVMFLLAPLFFFELMELRGRWRPFLVLVPAMLLWVNTHGSFLVAPVFAACLLGERLACFAAARLRGRTGRALPDRGASLAHWTQAVRGQAPRPDGPQIGRPASRHNPASGAAGIRLAAALLGALLLCTLASPFGLELPRRILGDFGAYAVSRTFTIEEHLPLAFGQYPLFWALMAATLASFGLAIRRLRLFHLGSFAATSALALSSVRFVALAALIHGCILMLNLQPSLERLVPARLARARLALLPLLALGGILAFRDAFAAGREARFGLGVNERRFPVAAVGFLREQGFEGNLFNSWELGGYALWQLPKSRPVIDGRCLEAQLSLYPQLLQLDGAGLGQYLEEHRVQGALLSRSDRHFAELFAASPRFMRAFFDDQAVVYLRRGAGGKLPAARFIRPESYDFSYLAPLAKGEHAAEVEAELRSSVEQSPRSFTPRFLLAFFLEVQGREEALEHYQAAAELNPAFGYTHYALGMRAGGLALSLGRWEQAERFLREGLRHAEKSPSVEAMLATALAQQRKYPEAEALFARALDRVPEDAAALVNLGFLYVDTGRPAQAVPLFTRARALAPADPNALYGLALSLQESGRKAEAEPRWKEFLADFPQSPWAQRARERLGQ